MDFQDRVKDWMVACFDTGATFDVQERLHRFLEEALELAQAAGGSRDEAIALVEYVFSRPAGEPRLEAGGVILTLAGLCSASGFDMIEAGEAELARNWDRIDIIRAKRAARPRNSPLPQRT
ncbi:hypothetical protein SAMN02983003_0698 [Devosia enhydra]|uniref:Uncharacterized protein n=1 Tax=Devosia enhydra TaxID=665118 RepID=A0A1K2HTX2_9HYPH|nr:hypothetical protein [Devosia enhydra]SFZ81799.1 hypothetical protein SAMN02983003_0698 [Devosia enhydra]